MFNEEKRVDTCAAFAFVDKAQLVGECIGVAHAAKVQVFEGARH
jgi:hypothetical protein